MLFFFFFKKLYWFFFTFCFCLLFKFDFLNTATGWEIVSGCLKKRCPWPSSRSGPSETRATSFQFESHRLFVGVCPWKDGHDEPWLSFWYIWNEGNIVLVSDGPNLDLFLGPDMDDGHGRRFLTAWSAMAIRLLRQPLAVSQSVAVFKRIKIQNTKKKKSKKKINIIK